VATSFGARAAAFLVALSPVACDLSTPATDDDELAVVAFDLERAEPPGVVADGAWAVVPRARLHFSLAVEGRAEALILSAGDRVLAELPPGTSSYVDDCDAGPCGTGEAGEVEYTLAAVGRGDEPPMAARSLLVRVVEASGAPEGT
jgi:hypothetical protein